MMPMSDLNSLTLNAALNEAVEWLTAAEYAQAVARCEDLLSSYPDAVRVLSVRARALQALGETARAAQDYSRVLEITPADEQSLAGLMRCQLRFGQRREALLTAWQLLDYDTGHVDAARLVREAGGDVRRAGRVLRVRRRFAAGFTNQAIADLRAMRDAAPDRVDLQVILAEMLWRAGLRVTTVELCQAILDAQPDCLNAHILLYALWSQMGSTHMSAVHLKAASRLDPDFRETAAWLKDRSPVPLQDVPALIDLARREALAGSDEDERDRSAWVDQLIASAAGPAPGDAVLRDAVAASAGPTSGADRHSQALDAQDDLDVEEEGGVLSGFAGVIFPPAPLDWQPGGEQDAIAQPEAPGSDTEVDEALPAWLSAMREQSRSLSESDWDALAPAEAPAVAAGASAQGGLRDETTPEAPPRSSSASQPVPPADPESDFAPLEWQPAEVASAPLVVETAPLAEPILQPIIHSAVGRAEKPETVSPGRSGGRSKPRPARQKWSAEDLLLLARRAIQAAEYEQAAQHYARLVTLGRKLDEVMADLDAATHAYPDVPEFHTLLGRVYTRKGDVSAALAAYQRALKLKS